MATADCGSVKVTDGPTPDQKRPLALTSEHRRCQSDESESRRSRCRGTVAASRSQRRGWPGRACTGQRGSLAALAAAGLLAPAPDRAPKPPAPRGLPLSGARPMLDERHQLADSKQGPKPRQVRPGQRPPGPLKSRPGSRTMTPKRRAPGSYSVVDRSYRRTAPNYYGDDTREQ
jgi:hypothetical protein